MQVLYFPSFPPLPLKFMSSEPILNIVLHTNTHTITPFSSVCMHMYLGMSTWAWITYQNFILKKTDSPSNH